MVDLQKCDYLIKGGWLIVKLSSSHASWMLIRWFRLEFARRDWFVPDMFPFKLGLFYFGEEIVYAYVELGNPDIF